MVGRKASHTLSLDVVASYEFKEHVRISVVEWLGDNTVIVLTDSYDLIAFDTVLLSPIETCSVKDADIVWSIHPSCSTPSFQSSTRAAQDKSVYMLGVRTCCRVVVKTWAQRISSLVGSGEWMEAMALLLDRLDLTKEGTSAKDTVHLSARNSGYRSLVDGGANLINEYIEHALPEHELSSDNLSGSFEIIGAVCMEFCSSIGRLDILFGNVFVRFRKADKLDIYFDLLEPFILNGRINRASPNVMKAMIEDYISKGKRDLAEECILHFDVRPAVVTDDCFGCYFLSNLVMFDTDSLIKLCRANKLFSALIYVYNQGLLDFTTPVRELLVGAIVNLEPNVFYRSTPNAPKSAEFGRESLERLFAYAHTLLLGEARGPKVRAELLTYIFDPSEDLDTLIKDNSGSYHPFAKLRRMISHACKNTFAFVTSFLDTDAASSDEFFPSGAEVLPFSAKFA